MPGWNETLSFSLWIGVALKSSAVLMAAGLAVLFLRRRSAAARHVVWTGVFAALLALPVLSVLLPALRLPVPHAFLPDGAAFQIGSSSSSDALNLQSRPSAVPAVQMKPKPWSLDWRISLLFVWGLGTALSLGQMAMSWAAIRRIRRTARVLTLPEFSSLIADLGIKAKVGLLEAGPGSMPMVFGLLRSRIFIPSDALQWNEERRHTVILHELAHVQRGDCLTHLLARIAIGFYWWNPLAWFGWREFLKERERAADDLVLNLGARPSEYANHLLEIASGMQLSPVAGWAAVAMARRSQLESRLLAILDTGRNRKTVRHATAMATVALAIGIAVPLAALQSQDSTSSNLADPAAIVSAATAQRSPQMLDRAAHAAEALRNYDLARKLLEASLALRAQISGEQNPNYGVGLLNLGDLEREQGKFDLAEAFYTKALHTLGNTSEGAPVLIHLGAIALANKNVPEALSDFDRAQSLNPADGGLSDMWIAVAQEQQETLEQADSFYQSALKKADPNSSNAATIMELYGQLLRREGRENEAKSMQDQSAAIRNALGAKASSGVQTGANVYKIGGDVTAPVLVSKVEPEYTQDARAAKYQGSVLLYAEIGPDGLAHNIAVRHGLGLGLNEKAIQAISLWRFKPSSKDGQPVAVSANIEVNFRLL
ncbi:MAG TPA: TonB family protein [Bryobacteraceae bacterium]|nr:TonB family protein [Bryobacteraceae bacterium]